MNTQDFILKKYLPRIEFHSYEDFKQNYRCLSPDNFNYAYDVIDEWAKAFPDKPALVWTDDHGQEERYTFSEISRLSNRVANFFDSVLHIKKGDAVLLLLKQRVEVWLSLLALHKLGAVAIPATYLLTKKDIVYRCMSAKIRCICAIDDPEIIQHITEALPECPSVENFCAVGENVPEHCVDFRRGYRAQPDYFARRENKITDPMLLYFSSGTTGMPKMILHDYSYPLGHIVTAKYWHKIEDGGLHLTVADSGWAKFAWGKIYGQWMCGAVIVAYDDDKFHADNLLKTITRLKLTTFCAPPTIYRFLIKEDLSQYDFSSIKHCTIAGEPLNPEVFHKFRELTGLKVTEGFGQTETSVILANYEWFPIKPGSTGKPSPLYDIDIVDEDGNSCEDGIIGSIVIKTAPGNRPLGLFREYQNDPEMMSRSWKNGVYDTGDLAWRDSEGYFWFEGRNDDVIKCSGYRIGPFEVESVLLTHPSVLECAVTAAPDPIRGQVVKATVVLAKGYRPGDELKRELQDHVKKLTAPYKYPRILEFAEELPKTISGKIRRKQIREESHR